MPRCAYVPQEGQVHGCSEQVRVCHLGWRPSWIRPPFCRRTRGAGMQVIVTWLCAALGLSALIPGAAAEIDTTGGPWFGSPRGDKDFLAPGEVVLTFDDGPTPRNSRTILAALAA